MVVDERILNESLGRWLQMVDGLPNFTAQVGDPAESVLESWDIRAAQATCDGIGTLQIFRACLLYTSPSPRDRQKSRMPSSA